MATPGFAGKILLVNLTTKKIDSSIQPNTKYMAAATALPLQSSGISAWHRANGICRMHSIREIWSP